MAGTSERDAAVRRFAERALLDVGTPGAAGTPAVLLLGPHGSGKSSLLTHLARWAQPLPVALLDLAAQGRRGRQPIDVVARLVFQLNEPKHRIPPLNFRTAGTLLMALNTEIDSVDRGQALRDVQAALRNSGTDANRREALNGVVEPLAQIMLTAMGAPGWTSALPAAVRLLPAWRGRGTNLHTRRLLSRLRERRVSTDDNFLVDLNQRYREEGPRARAEAEAVLFEAFLADLQDSYAARRARRGRTTRCLLLLDNVDSPLGDQVFQGLLRARDRTRTRDPLVVLATASRRPEALVRREAGGVPDAARYLGCWPDRRFRPVAVDETLHAGQLRDLSRREVEQRCERVLSTLPTAPQAMPQHDGDGPDDDVKWLGWLVHELTRGQPAATGVVLRALGTFPATTPWEDRLRELFTPERVTEILRLLLPESVSGAAGEDLRAMLRRSAAAVSLGDAGVTDELSAHMSAAVVADFTRFLGDPLRTMHVVTGDDRRDGPPGTLHPVLRFLLLRQLATEGPRQAEWDAAHGALRRRALRRAEDGDEDAACQVAYHDLAMGDLAAAAAYLDGCFPRMPAEDWFRLLVRLRRAPVRTPGGTLDLAPRVHLDALVAHLGDPGAGVRSPRLRTVTRLLAASWISPEPRDDPATDHVGDPYRNPLGDPYGDLYAEIGAEIRVLHGMADGVADRAALMSKAEQFEKGRPWW